MTLPRDLEQALATFGLENFRPGQREVIESIVAGNDCMCIMPTGGGKSLCYQLPSIIRSGLTIVFSPLIALMKDQVDALSARGIAAALINSSLSASEQSARLQAVASGKYRLVYVAPERLRNNRFLDAIRATPIQLLAVDEAHCISQWGHDFRPDYTRIGRFRELLGGVQTVALTATATPRVRTDIVEVLQLKKPKHFMSGFARPNLHFGVVSTNSDREKEEELDKFLKKEKGAGIIYCATRKRCEAIVEFIANRHRIPVGAYHAGLIPEQRKTIQERFMKNDLKIVVATNAFGMGIDKPDLRFVIHFNMPGSLEAYYQEAGRAGRDGKPSQCVMLYSFQDRRIQEFFIDNNYPDRGLIKSVYEFLLAQQDDPIELTLEEIRDRMGLSISPEAVGSCLQILSRTGVLDRLEMGGGMAMIRIDSDLPTLVDMLPREAKVQRTVMRLLERLVGDRRSEEIYVHPRWLLQESGMQREGLQRALREISKLQEVDYVPPFRGRAVHLRRHDLGFEDLGIDFNNLRERKRAEYDRLDQVVSYAQLPLCRQSSILKYFGDSSADPCGRCDRCRRVPGWPELKTVAKKESTSPSAAASNTPAPVGGGTSALEALETIVDAIERIHGRLGKHLISQYLCGSQNAKVQKLNLHRLSGFGLLQGSRQTDALTLLDALLAAGILRQREISRNRPTVEVASQWHEPEQRQRMLSMVQVPPSLRGRLSQLATASPQDRQRVATADCTVSSLPAELPEVSDARHNRQSGSVPVVATQATGKTQELELDPGDPNGAAGDGNNVNGVEVTSADRDTATGADRGTALLNGTVSVKPPHSSAMMAATSPQAPGDLDVTAPIQQDADSDWRWTTLLFSRQHSWAEVMQIRQMTDAELAGSLCAALKAGQQVKRAWISGGGGVVLSSGQQRVVRELQRRVAAGVR